MARKPFGFWTKETCIQVAKECTSYYEFQTKHPNAYQKARVNGWLEDIRFLLPSRKPNGWWTKERCLDEALRYSKRKDFEKAGGAAYSVARKNGWLDEICSHMSKREVRTTGYWTTEKLFEAAAPYKTRAYFEAGNRAAYSAAVRSGLLDTICQHTEPLILPHGYWTKERCEEEAWKYTTMGAFRHHSKGAFDAARRNGWLDDVAWHLTSAKPLDTIYLIRETLPESDLYKIKVGITRWDLGDRRIKQAFRHFQNPIVMAHHRTILARNHERAVLRKFGITPDLTHIGKADGYSELRMLTAEEIGEAIRMVTA